ncbi:thiamine phosphate synthase [Psychrobacillus vulpis]|uniref:Thiamine-phosphate synthase n=1 Tax=Psychrobacillus vulpis TaxID=2325572 RepID=A0A544TTR6_9BACI|nr:thiamine phosphate synthase [Psychrobacillus vulpis]TQR20849.1 thiamine phosphate synthase [Psychrobacillus vulpis]
MNRNILNLYFIMGSQNCGNADPLHVLESALKGGISCFQFREKGEGARQGEDYIKYARSCQNLCKKYGVPFIVNDDVRLAEELQADGVHVGQDDELAQHVRVRMPGKILGVSVHTSEEVVSAIQAGADYIGVGPIYETKSKADAKPAAGLSFLTKIVTEYPELPIVGIGGITIENAKRVIEAGADGVSIISAISQAEDVQGTVKQLLNIVK